MDLKALLDMFLPTLGQQGVDTLAGELHGVMDDAKEPWKKAILALVADGVTKFGPLGIQHAQDAIHSLSEGDAPKLNWADLEVASDVLAHLENAEADRKSAAKAFIIKVGRILGMVLSGFIKGLTKA